MKYALARQMITPAEPVWQCGFAARTRKSEGIHDNLYATLLLLEDDQGARAALISLDIIGGDRSFITELRADLKEQYGLDQVLLNFSHTHGAVRIFGQAASKEDFGGHFWNHRESEQDSQAAQAYSKHVHETILALAGQARADLAPGSLSLLRGQSDFGLSRRFPNPDGSIAWLPYDNPAAMDPDLYLLKLEDKDGGLAGLIYQYACHPTTLGSDNYLITSDYPGVVRRILENYHPGLTTLFLQGCGADIKPRATATPTGFKQCSFAELEEAAGGLAVEINSLLATSGWRRLELDLAYRQEDLRLFASSWPESKWQELLADPATPDYMKRALEHRQKTKTGRSAYLPLEISVLRLDKTACLLALENEVVSSYGKKIKRLFGQDILALGYSNSCRGYIPDREVIRQGGYEADSFKLLGLSGPYYEEIEDIILGRAAGLLADCFYGGKKNG